MREALRSRAPVPRAIGVLVGFEGQPHEIQTSLTCWVTLAANLLEHAEAGLLPRKLRG